MEYYDSKIYKNLNVQKADIVLIRLVKIDSYLIIITIYIHVYITDKIYLLLFKDLIKRVILLEQLVL